MVLGEMRGKDDEYDYLFKGGCAARPRVLHAAPSAWHWELGLDWDVTLNSQFSGRGGFMVVFRCAGEEGGCW